jgi:hypothetical protein
LKLLDEGKGYGKVEVEGIGAFEDQGQSKARVKRAPAIPDQFVNFFSTKEL